MLREKSFQFDIVKYLKKVPYDVLEVLDIIVCPVDVIEPRNLDQPPIVVAVNVVADRPGFESVQEHFGQNI